MVSLEAFILWGEENYLADKHSNGAPTDNGTG